MMHNQGKRKSSIRRQSTSRIKKNLPNRENIIQMTEANPIRANSQTNHPEDYSILH
jgi:hypothetical protein